MSDLREVDLERGMPTVDQAVKQLTFYLHNSRAQGYKVLKLIHGYGSSGTGGRIRVEVRKYLGRLAARGEVKGFIPGEEFSIFQEETRRALLLCGELRRDRDLDWHNNGVTFVILSGGR